ncbi:MAG TPA: hypothetical protein VGX75_14265 [bacterium]|nr:hypothetical protein [bacterium]
METSPDLPAIITSTAAGRRLRPRTDLLEPGWMFWELRNLNMLRVVGLVTEHRRFADAHDLETEIRSVVSRCFKCAWWRGMAYGAVADVPAISLNLDDLKVLVDLYANAKGTLQWVILVTDDARVALGVHTWLESYLSPVYRGILQALSEAGYRVAGARRETDGLWKFLTGVADAEAAIGSFGTRHAAFPEFRNPVTGEQQQGP